MKRITIKWADDVADTVRDVDSMWMEGKFIVLADLPRPLVHQRETEYIHSDLVLNVKVEETFEPRRAEFGGVQVGHAGNLQPQGW